MCTFVFKFFKCLVLSKAGDTGSYTCMARNVAGRDLYDRTLRVQGKLLDMTNHFRVQGELSTRNLKIKNFK